MQTVGKKYDCGFSEEDTSKTITLKLQDVHLSFLIPQFKHKIFSDMSVAIWHLQMFLCINIVLSE